MIALPIYNIILKAKKPCYKPYPKELVTYGDHLRKKRLDLDLSQPQVAKMFNVTTDCITNWEVNRNNPEIKLIPKIIEFLGYSPEINEHPIKRYRIERGINQKEMARMLGIDPTTLGRIEKGGKRITNEVKTKLNTIYNKSRISLYKN